MSFANLLIEGLSNSVGAATVNSSIEEEDGCRSGSGALERTGTNVNWVPSVVHSTLSPNFGVTKGRMEL